MTTLNDERIRMRLIRRERVNARRKEAVQTAKGKSIRVLLIRTTITGQLGEISPIRLNEIVTKKGVFALFSRRLTGKSVWSPAGWNSNSTIKLSTFRRKRAARSRIHWKVSRSLDSPRLINRLTQISGTKAARGIFFSHSKIYSVKTRKGRRRRLNNLRHFVSQSAVELGVVGCLAISKVIIMRLESIPGPFCVISWTSDIQYVIRFPI